MVNFTKSFQVKIQNEDEELALLRFLHDIGYHWHSGNSLEKYHYFSGAHVDGGYDVYECNAHTKRVSRTIGTRSGVPMYSVNEVLVYANPKIQISSIDDLL